MFRQGIRTAIERALALTPRGCVRHDTLRVNRLSGQLQVEWPAREIHPWDRDLPPDRQAKVFCAQTITDADVAIFRLFQMLPEINAITIRVVEPHTMGRVLMAGTVLRKDLFASALPSSSQMRLKLWHSIPDE